MRQYRIDWSQREGETVCRLVEGNTAAEVLPGFGMNIIRFIAGGEDVVLPPPSISALKAAPFRYGIAALSPPGKTSNARFAYRGVEYRLPSRNGKHNVHGEIGRWPWRIESYGADADSGAYLQASFAYRHDSGGFAAYPADLEFSVTLRLKNGELALEGCARNAGDRSAPFSLGYHPYFCCDPNHTILEVPTFAQWSIGGDGNFDALREATDLALRLREGIAVSDIQEKLLCVQCRSFDDSERSSPYICALTDRESGRRILFQTDGLFAVMIIFLPPWGEAVSLEPHTCIPNAFNLSRDASETGASAIAPGQHIQFGWRIRVESDASE
ncbi:aldose 1-epimerase [Paenibacillus sp. PAMC21692]|uniref:aldose 1-epimerase n=1 Tax=Paenibacillus sp. PAMC21692 TaxID=2762320 RepID=UPI00164D0908|nr:aldose 1-epimerase [Paenibacillus sp. PAMC21692]QNK59579.1 aldose 1-epimerase [Paenibacillus sp. PAMC21692]